MTFLPNTATGIHRWQFTACRKDGKVLATYTTQEASHYPEAKKRAVAFFKDRLLRESGVTIQVEAV